MQKFGGLLIGIIFIIVGVFLFVKNDYLIKNCTVEAVAIVVDMDEQIDTDSDANTSYLYYPIIEYKVNDKTIKSKMDSGSSTPSYSIGDKVTILYNPNKTNEFIVKGDKSSNIFSIVFIVIGLLVTIYGIITLVKKEQ